MRDVSTELRSLSSLKVKIKVCIQSKFDCLIHEMFLINELRPSLNVQSDSIRAKVFNPFLFLHVFNSPFCTFSYFTYFYFLVLYLSVCKILSSLLSLIMTEVRSKRRSFFPIIFTSICFKKTLIIKNEEKRFCRDNLWKNSMESTCWGGCWWWCAGLRYGLLGKRGPLTRKQLRSSVIFLTDSVLQTRNFQRREMPRAPPLTNIIVWL